jgi:hypothetical protein
MRSSGRRFAALAVSAMTTVLMTVMPGSPAHASVGCYAAGCKGKDPQSMGCSTDAITGAQKTTADGRIVQLRYSPACGAAWGRLQKSYVDDYVAVYSNNGLGYYYTYVDGSHTWTAMVQDNGSYTAYADYESGCCQSLTASF